MTLDETKGRIICKLKILSELKINIESKSDFDIRMNGLQEILNDCKIGLEEYPDDPVLSFVKIKTERSISIMNTALLFNVVNQP